MLRHALHARACLLRAGLARRTSAGCCGWLLWEALMRSCGLEHAHLQVAEALHSICQAQTVKFRWTECMWLPNV